MNKTFGTFKELDTPVREFVTKRLIGVSRDTSVKEAASKMVEFNISLIVIVDNNDVVGLLTDADLKEKVVAKGLPLDTPVEKIMTQNIIKASINTSVGKVMEIMSKKKIKHVLISERNRIIGVIAFRDLIDMERHKLETFISRE